MPSIPATSLFMTDCLSHLRREGFVFNSQTGTGAEFYQVNLPIAKIRRKLAVSVIVLSMSDLDFNSAKGAAQ